MFVYKLVSKGGTWGIGRSSKKAIIKQKIEYACKHYPESTVTLEKDGKVLTTDVCSTL